MKTIDDVHLKKICHFGKGKECCSWLMLLPPEGFVCGKEDRGLNANVILRRKEKTMVAMGDHCSGPPDFIPKAS